MSLVFEFLYTIWSLLAWVVDIVENVFLQLAGLEDVHMGGETVEQSQDIVSILLNEPIVRQTFANLVIISITLLMFFTILQIIREQYRNKDGGNPYMIAFRMFKGIVLFVLISVACFVGLHVGRLVTLEIDRATKTDDKRSPIAGLIFNAMGHNANIMRLLEREESRSSGQRSEMFNGNQFPRANFPLLSSERYCIGDTQYTLGEETRIFPRYTNALDGNGFEWVQVRYQYIDRQAHGYPVAGYSYVQVGQTTEITPITPYMYFCLWGTGYHKCTHDFFAGDVLLPPDDGATKHPKKEEEEEEEEGGAPASGFIVFQRPVGDTCSNRIGWPNTEEGRKGAFARYIDLVSQIEGNQVSFESFNGTADPIPSGQMESAWISNVCTFGEFQERNDTWELHPPGGSWIINPSDGGPPWTMQPPQEPWILHPKPPGEDDPPLPEISSDDVQSFTITYLRIPHPGKVKTERYFYDHVLPNSLMPHYTAQFDPKGLDSQTRNLWTAKGIDDIMKGKSQPNNVGLSGNNNNNTLYYLYTFDHVALNEASAVDDSKAVDFKTSAALGSAPMGYINKQVVFALYDLRKMDWIAGFIGIFVVTGVFLIFTIGLIQRLMELIVLYIMSPVTLAMFPFDDGGSFKSNFVQPFYKKITYVIAVILSLNFFFFIHPTLQELSFFRQATNLEGGEHSWSNIWATRANIMMSLLITIALLALLPRIRASIQEMLGAASIEEKSITKTFASVIEDAKKGGTVVAASGMAVVAKMVSRRAQPYQSYQGTALLRNTTTPGRGIAGIKLGLLAAATDNKDRVTGSSFLMQLGQSPSQPGFLAASADPVWQGQIGQTFAKALLDCEGGILLQGKMPSPKVNAITAPTPLQTKLPDAKAVIIQKRIDKSGQIADVIMAANQWQSVIRSLEESSGQAIEISPEEKLSGVLKPAVQTSINTAIIGERTKLAQSIMKAVTGTEKESDFKKYLMEGGTSAAEAQKIINTMKTGSISEIKQIQGVDKSIIKAFSAEGVADIVKPFDINNIEKALLGIKQLTQEQVQAAKTALEILRQNKPSLLADALKNNTVLTRANMGLEGLANVSERKMLESNMNLLNKVISRAATTNRTKKDAQTDIETRAKIVDKVEQFDDTWQGYSKISGPIRKNASREEMLKLLEAGNLARGPMFHKFQSEVHTGSIGYSFRIGPQKVTLAPNDQTLKDILKRENNIAIITNDKGEKVLDLTIDDKNLIINLYQTYYQQEFMNFADQLTDKTDIPDAEDTSKDHNRGQITKAFKPVQTIIDSMDQATKTAILTNPRFNEMFQKGDNNGIAYNLRLVAEGNTDASIFKGSRNKEVFASVPGARDAINLASVFDRMLGDAGSIMKGESLEVNTKNINMVVLQITMVDIIQNTVKTLINDHQQDPAQSPQKDAEIKAAKELLKSYSGIEKKLIMIIRQGKSGNKT